MIAGITWVKTVKRKDKVKFRPEIKQKILAMLRSGKLNQVSGYMHTDGYEEGYCVLGVATELYREEKGYDWVKNIDLLSKEEEEFPSREVVAWLFGVPSCEDRSYYDENVFRCENTPIVIQLRKKIAANSDTKDYLWSRSDTDAENLARTYLLSDFNDAGATFEELADIIEEQF